MEHLAGDCRLWSLSLVCLFGGRPLGTRPHECLDWYHSRSSCWFFEIYWADQTFKNKLSLALFTKLLLVFLATGLFFGGCHEFEDVWGETREVWSIKNDIWSHKELPMATFKPFGSSASRTVLQIACLWCWLALSAAIHVYKLHQTVKINRDVTKGKLEAHDNGKLDSSSNEDSFEKAGVDEEAASEPKPASASEDEA